MPALLLDKEKCLRNLDRMALKAKGQGLRFRPHCKTHQSAEIANWARDFGVEAITVSHSPWPDILLRRVGRISWWPSPSNQAK